MAVMNSAPSDTLEMPEVPWTEELVRSYERHPAAMGLARWAVYIQDGRSG